MVLLPSSGQWAAERRHEKKNNTYDDDDDDDDDRGQRNKNKIVKNRQIFKKKMCFNKLHNSLDLKRALPFTHLSICIHVVVRLRWIDLGKEETCLRSTVLGVNVARHREACLQNFLGIIDRCLQ